MPILFSRTVALAIVLTAAACSRKPSVVKAEPQQPSSLKPETERKAAPDFTLKGADGKEMALSSLKGKVVLLDFWATWCTPCLIEIPWLVEFQKTYKDRGFTVLGVSADEDGWEVVKPFIAKKQLNYPVLLSDGMVEQKYGGIEALPTTFLLDREGRIASVHIGLSSKQEFEDEIKALLD